MITAAICLFLAACVFLATEPKRRRIQRSMAHDAAVEAARRGVQKAQGALVAANVMRDCWPWLPPDDPTIARLANDCELAQQRVADAMDTLARAQADPL
jgi:hypothetical protein